MAGGTATGRVSKRETGTEGGGDEIGEDGAEYEPRGFVGSFSKRD